MFINTSFSIFLIISFICALPLFFFKIKEHKTFFILYSFVVISHIIIALIQSSGYTLIGTEHDAIKFFNRAQAIALTGQFRPYWSGSHLYANLLGLLFTTTGISMFLGCLTSITAFCSAFVLFYRLLQKANVPHISFIMVILTIFYVVLPSTMIFTSVTLRESWEILLIILSITITYSFINNPHIIKVTTLAIIMAIMFLFHNAFSILCMLMPLALLLPFNQNLDDNDNRFFNFSNARIRIISAIILIIYIVTIAPTLNSITPIFSHLSIVKQIERGTIDNYIQKRRANIENARSYYSVILDKTNMFTKATSAVGIVLSYMFRPLPWEIYNSKDLYAFAESLLRLTLLGIYFFGFFYMTRRERSLSLFLGFYYGLLTLLWASGTNNWGTAVRHHITHQWILVIISTMALIAVNRKLKKRLPLLAHACDNTPTQYNTKT